MLKIFLFLLLREMGLFCLKASDGGGTLRSLLTETGSIWRRCELHLNYRLDVCLMSVNLLILPCAYLKTDTERTRVQGRGLSIRKSHLSCLVGEEWWPFRGLGRYSKGNQTSAMLLEARGYRMSYWVRVDWMRSHWVDCLLQGPGCPLQGFLKNPHVLPTWEKEPLNVSNQRASIVKEDQPQPQWSQRHLPPFLLFSPRFHNPWGAETWKREREEVEKWKSQQVPICLSQGRHGASNYS